MTATLPTITPATLAQALGQQPQAVMVDVREGPELAQLPLTGLRARHIPLGQLPQHLQTLPTDQPIYLFCQAAMRSSMAQAYLQQQGFTQAINVTGGALAWAAYVRSSS